MTVSPFDHVKGINQKEYNYEVVDKNSYSSYIINKALSFSRDTIFLANEINKYQVEPQQHYDFLYYSVSKKHRYGWVKTKKDEDAEFLASVYKIRHERALEMVKILTKEEIANIRLEHDKGGIQTTAPK